MDNHKVLILLPESLEIQEHIAFISTIFQKQYDETESIARDVQWKTKYYETTLDLYIDTYDVLQEWVNDFVSDECKELRDVISGIIFVFKDEDHKPPVECLKNLIDERIEDFTAKFFIGCYFNENVIEEDELYELNSDLLVQNFEIVNWFDKPDPSMDKVSSERIKEIIDVHPWLSHPETLKKNQGQINISPIDLDSFMTKLEQAKERYQTFDDSKEAELFIEKIIDELSDMIV